MGRSKEAFKKAQMGFVEAYECMTIRANATQGNGVFIMLGFFTGWVAFVCSGQMAAAYFMAHAGNTLFPIQNRGELSMLYAFLFLFMAARGSGIWSIDALRGTADK